MSFFRVIYYLLYHRRRRKYQIFLLIFIIFIIFYWWIEISSYKNSIGINSKDKFNIENENLGKENEIYFKYIENPYNIDIWNIIKEANRKYQENNTKYLVYSCRFMCGGNFIIKNLFKKYHFN